MASPIARIRTLNKLRETMQTTTPRRTEADVPRSFLDFCGWLGVRLTAGQAELVRVAYDGGQPVDDGLARRLFGAEVPMGRRSVVCAVCGARAGKSYVLVALRLVHGMLVRDLSTLAPGQRAVALIVAPNDRLRREVLNYAIGAVQSKPELAALLAGQPSSDGFGVWRGEQIVRFETGVATAGGYGARGRSLTDFALDECAFFRDEAFRVNDEEIFRAGSARVLPGGQTIVASTPWAETGLLHRLWKTRPPDTVIAHAPTLALQDTPTTRAYVAREQARDPENAAREFEAQFMASGSTVFFESSTIDGAISEEPFEPQPGDMIAAGADFGFRSDSSALLLVAMRDGVLHVFDGAEKRPQGAPLKPSVTVAAFAELLAGRCGCLMADQHYREAIAEHLEAHGLSYLPAPGVPADTYVRARMLLREGVVQIHPLELRDRLVQQMREVHGRPTSGGGMTIVHPRWATGGHGDLVAALVLALWQLWGDAVPKPKPLPGSEEWRKEQRRARVDYFAQLDQPVGRSRAPGGAADRGGSKHRRGER